MVASLSPESPALARLSNGEGENGPGEAVMDRVFVKPGEADLTGAS